MFEQKKTKQDEQNLAYSLIQSPELGASKPNLFRNPFFEGCDV
jgi:hypothetical protein